MDETPPRGRKRSTASAADELAAALRKAVDPAHGEALIGRGSAILVACSGGADSTALADALVSFARARPELELRVAVGHVDHGLREESAREAEGVRALAEKLETPFFLEKLDAAALRQAVEIHGLEAAARNFRYPALERLAQRAGCALVATAHTRRDQAETVLLRLARGGGPGALAGVRARRRLGKLWLVRPLLDVSRAATERYCEERALSFTEDPHNRDPKRSRARLRQAFDTLAGLLNPRLEEGLAAAAKIAAEEDAYLDLLAHNALRSALQMEAGESDAPPDLRRPIRIEALQRLPDPLLRRALLLLAGAFDARPEREHLLGLVRTIRRGEGILDLPGARAEVRGGRLHFQIGHAERPDQASPAPLAIPCAGVYAWGKLQLEVEELGDTRAHALAPGETVLIDLARAPFPWTVRACAPGDRFRPARGRSKKVSELWIDAKVPKEARGSLPLISDANGAVFYVHALRAGEASLPPRALSVSLRFRGEAGASLSSYNSAVVEERADQLGASIPASFRPVDEEPR